MERNGLISELMQAAVEFHERRLWKRFTNFDCFVVHVPGKDDPLLACVMGDAGEQFGLMLFQGPRAAESFTALTAGDGPGDDAAESMDMLSFSMDAFGEIAPEVQTFFRKAGLHPRHDQQVPNFMVKPPNRHVRMPNDEELALLLAVLKAVTLADRRKLLAPATLDDAEGVCAVKLEGDLLNPTVTVSRERLTRSEVISWPHAFATSGLDLSGLELLNGTWLVGTPVLPAGIKDDDRSMQLLLVADDASGMVLQAKPFFSEQIQEAADALVETFGRCLPKGRRGVARTMVFSNRQLHDTIVPVLQKAGVKCIYIPAIPKLQKIAAEFLGFLGEDSPSLQEYLEAGDVEEDQVPAADDLAGWKEADRRLLLQFVDHLRHGERMRSPRAIKRYFGDEDIGHYLKEHEKQGIAMAFSSWGMLDYRPSKNSQTQAEKMLAQGLPKAQEVLLRARMEAHPTVYRVAGFDPKAGTVDLEDVLLGGSVRVYDQLLSENIGNSTFLAARAFAAGRFHFLEVVGPPLGAQMGMEAVEFLRDCGLDFTREGLKREAHKFGWLWDWSDQWQADWVPPRLCNTDGDDLLMHTASFSVADLAAVRQALLQRKDIDHDEHEDEFVWSKDTGKGAKMLGGPVTLGRIEFVGDELVLTVNSAKRFNTARKWLTALPGVEFKSARTESVEPGKDRPLGARIAKSKPVEITPEMAHGLQEMVDKQYREWIDTPLPILGGKTPRQACRTPAGREQVTTLIRTMPDPMGQASICIPRQAMLRELGLAADVPSPTPSMPRQTLSGLGSLEFDPTDPSAIESPIESSPDRVGRNDPCPCGSGRKYKKCCGR